MLLQVHFQYHSKSTQVALNPRCISEMPTALFCWATVAEAVLPCPTSWPPAPSPPPAASRPRHRPRVSTSGPACACPGWRPFPACLQVPPPGLKLGAALFPQGTLPGARRQHCAFSGLPRDCHHMCKKPPGDVPSLLPTQSCPPATSSPSVLPATAQNFSSKLSLSHE